MCVSAEPRAMHSHLELPSGWLLAPASVATASAPADPSAYAFLDLLRPHEDLLREALAAFGSALGALTFSPSSELCMSGTGRVVSPRSASNVCPCTAGAINLEMETWEINTGRRSCWSTTVCMQALGSREVSHYLMKMSHLWAPHSLRVHLGSSHLEACHSAAQA